MKTLFALILSAALAYTQNGVTVSGKHGDSAIMGNSANCAACHMTTTSTRMTFGKMSTYPVFRNVTVFRTYTTALFHKYTAYFVGFAQSVNNPSPAICLACHNSASSRYSVSTSIRTHAVSINSQTHQQEIYPTQTRRARSGLIFTTKQPDALMSHSLGWDLYGSSFGLYTTEFKLGKRRPKTATVKTWDKVIKQKPLVRYGKGSNYCMDCHWPHSSYKPLYLRGDRPHFILGVTPLGRPEGRL